MDVNELALAVPLLLSAVLGTVTVLYVAGAVWFVTGMRPRSGTATLQPNVSVVVAARDEEDTIQRCLRALLAQDYPLERFEIIVVDDGSTDRTAARIRAMASEPVRLLSTTAACGHSGSKKAALTLGIEAARGDIILTTDADCLVPPSWITGMVRYFEADVGLVIGFSRIDLTAWEARAPAAQLDDGAGPEPERAPASQLDDCSGPAPERAPAAQLDDAAGAAHVGGFAGRPAGHPVMSGARWPTERSDGAGRAGSRRDWRQEYEATDFLILMGCIAGSTGHGHSMAASGQNLAYRKTVFEQVGGYTGLMHRASGDDVLLMQRVRRQPGWRIVFAASPGTHVLHPPAGSIRAFLRQRCRWASNAPCQLSMDPWFFAYMLNTYVLNGLLVLSPLLVAGGLLPVSGMLAGWLGKILAEGAVFARARRLFGGRALRRSFVLWTLLQPLQVLYVGAVGCAGVFTWKGQAHRWGRRVERSGNVR